MKRFASWVVAVALVFVFYYLEFWVWQIADRILLWIQDCNETLFWVLVVVEGMTVLGFAIAAAIGAGHVVVSASNGVCRSRKGTRYVVIGVLTALAGAGMFALLIWAAKTGVVQGRYWFMFFAFSTLLIFGLSLIGMRDESA